MSLENIIRPLGIVHELFEGIFHIPENIFFGGLHPVRIDRYLAIQFLSK
jgi:hypothetical protein